MSDQAAVRRILDVADELGRRVTELSEALRRSRVALRVVAVVVVAVAVLAAALAYNALQTADALAKAERAPCHAVNESNAKTKELWDFAFGLEPSPDDPPPSPSQRARIAKFRAFVDDTFMPSDCGG